MRPSYQVLLCTKMFLYTFLSQYLKIPKYSSISLNIWLYILVKIEANM